MSGGLDEPEYRTMIGDRLDDRTMARLHVFIAVVSLAVGIAIICFSSRPIIAGLLGFFLFIPCKVLWVRGSDIAKYPMKGLAKPLRRAFAIGDTIAIAIMAIALIADFLR